MLPAELIILLTCLGMTLAVETGAALVGAWTDRSQWHRIGNVIVSGLGVGALSILVAAWAIPLRVAAGAGLGVSYEVLNLRLLHLWAFPDDRLATLVAA